MSGTSPGAGDAVAAGGADSNAANPTTLHNGDQDTLHLVVNGVDYTGWEKVSVRRGIETMPSSFDILLTERYPGDAARVDVMAGDSCQVLLGSDPVLTGYIDRRMPVIGSQGNMVRVVGRSMCEDLVDCDVDPDKIPGLQITNSNAGAIATRLAAIYGVKIKVLSAGNGVVVPQLNMNIGAKVFSVIEEVCRYSALLAYDDVDGSLVLNGVGTARMASGFEEGVNIEAASAQASMDERYSDVAVYIVSTMSLSEFGPVPPAATAKDATVPRFRKICVVSEQAMLAPTIAAARANWEVARRYGRSQAIYLTVDSWRDSAGSIWAINTLALLNAPHLKIVGQTWIISEVNFRRDDTGTHADLVLMPPEAFQPDPTIQFPFRQEFNQSQPPGGGSAAANPVPASVTQKNNDAGSSAPGTGTLA